MTQARSSDAEPVDVTVIIAVRNGAQTIGRSLASVGSQRGCTVELIVVDALSDDATPEIVESFGSLITAYVRESDRGIYDAWNKGVARAKGEWCAFIGADDRFVGPDALALLLAAARSGGPRAVHVFGAVRLLSRTGSTLLSVNARDPAAHLRRGQMVPHPGSLHLRAALGSIGGFDSDLRIAGDLDALLRLSEQGGIVGIGETVVEMGAGGVSTSWELNRLRHAERLRVLRRHRPFVLALAWTARPFLLERIERFLLTAARLVAGEASARRGVARLRRALRRRL